MSQKTKPNPPLIPPTNPLMPLFNSEADFGSIIDDMEEVEHIDMEEIDNSSKTDAKNIVDNILELYGNEEFMKKVPKLKSRIETELESLRILLKMRRADEVTHDILIKAISQKSSNASLYRSLSEVQKTILSITVEINKCLDGLKQILKNYQLEFEFKDDNTNESSDSNNEENDIKDTHRGSKEFISQMISDNDKGDQ